jgi:hypothetical protein
LLFPSCSSLEFTREELRKQGGFSVFQKVEDDILLQYLQRLGLAHLVEEGEESMLLDEALDENLSSFQNSMIVVDEDSNSRDPNPNPNPTPNPNQLQQSFGAAARMSQLCVTCNDMSEMEVEVVDAAMHHREGIDSFGQNRANRMASAEDEVEDLANRLVGNRNASEMRIMSDNHNDVHESQPTTTCRSQIESNDMHVVGEDASRSGLSDMTSREKQHTTSSEPNEQNAAMSGGRSANRARAGIASSVIEHSLDIIRQQFLISPRHIRYACGREGERSSSFLLFLFPEFSCCCY